MPKGLARMQSKSNPGKYYNIMQGDDGVIYCECWAWKKNKTCPHLQQYLYEKSQFWQSASNKAGEKRMPLEDVIEREIRRLKG